MINNIGRSKFRREENTVLAENLNCGLMDIFDRLGYCAQQLQRYKSIFRALANLSREMSATTKKIDKAMAAVEFSPPDIIKTVRQP
jgi:hypothetical protein